MIIDLQTTLSGSTTAAGVKSGQALTATAISENVIDLRNAATPALVDEGILGAPDMWLIVQVLTAAAGGDAAKTLTITLESDTAVGLGAAPVVHFATAAIVGATLTAGAVLARVKIPSGDYKRYAGLRYTVSANFTAFQLLAWISPDIQRNIAYPVGFSVA